MKPVQAWALTMSVIPPAVVLLWLVLFGLMSLLRKKKKINYLKVHFPVAVIVTLLFSHPVVTKAAVKLVACRTVAGRNFLDAEFNISCTSEQYVFWATTVAIPMFICFTFGVPLAYALAMYRHVRKGTLSKRREIFGFLFSGFRKEIWWFELWNTLRKSLFTISAVIFAPAGVMMQTWAALVLLLLFIVVFSVAQPYEETYLNQLERGALSINSITLLCGLGLFTNEQASDDAKSATLAMIITVGIVGCNLVFVFSVGRTLCKYSQYCAVCKSKYTTKANKIQLASDRTAYAALKLRHSLQRKMTESAVVVVPSKEKVQNQATNQSTVAPSRLASARQLSRRLTADHVKKIRLTADHVKRIVVHDQAARIEDKYFEHRTAHIAKIKQQEKIADSRVQLRLAERKAKNKAIAVAGKGDTPDQMPRAKNTGEENDEPSKALAMQAEQLRLLIASKVSEESILIKVFERLDKNNNGALSPQEFTVLVDGVTKTKTTPGLVRAMWNAAQAMRTDTPGLSGEALSLSALRSFLAIGNVPVGRNEELIAASRDVAGAAVKRVDQGRSRGGGGGAQRVSRKYGLMPEKIR